MLVLLHTNKLCLLNCKVNKILQTLFTKKSIQVDIVFMNVLMFHQQDVTRRYFESFYRQNCGQYTDLFGDRNSTIFIVEY